MQAFSLVEPHDVPVRDRRRGRNPARKYIAGGTDLLQLAKDNVETPQRLVDLRGLLRLPAIHADADAACAWKPLARMSDVAAHREVVAAAGRCCRRRCWPPPRRRSAIWPRWAATCCSAPAAAISATPVSPATSACPDPAVRRSTARTGCMAILGGSDHCIATYPGDMARGPDRAGRAHGAHRAQWQSAPCRSTTFTRFRATRRTSKRFWRPAR